MGLMQPALIGDFFNKRCGNSTTLSVEEKKQSNTTYGFGYSRIELICLANEFAVSLQKETTFRPCVCTVMV